MRYGSEKRESVSTWVNKIIKKRINNYYLKKQELKIDRLM